MVNSFDYLIQSFRLSVIICIQFLGTYTLYTTCITNLSQFALAVISRSRCNATTTSKEGKKSRRLYTRLQHDTHFIYKHCVHISGYLFKRHLNRPRIEYEQTHCILLQNLCKVLLRLIWEIKIVIKQLQTRVL